MSNPSRIENLGAVLRGADRDYRDVVSVTVFTTNRDHFALINQVYAEYFQELFPFGTIAVLKLTRPFVIRTIA